MTPSARRFRWHVTLHQSPSVADVSIPPLCQRLGLLGRNIHTTHGLLVSEAIVRPARSGAGW